jgi:hypothetical protein
LVVLRSFPSGCTDVAITLAKDYPEFGVEMSSTVELSPNDARWLAANLLRAAEICPHGATSTRTRRPTSTPR